MLKIRIPTSVIIKPSACNGDVAPKPIIPIHNINERSFTI